MTTEERHRPFSNGSQFGDWDERNCCHCKKANYDPNVPTTCEIQDALDMAMWEDGSVSKDIAQRMGFLENEGKYTWRCGEFDEEVKAAQP